MAVSEFDFVSYLEESGQEGVPEGAFAHVDASGMYPRCFILGTNMFRAEMNMFHSLCNVSCFILVTNMS